MLLPKPWHDRHLLLYPFFGAFILDLSRSGSYNFVSFFGPEIMGSFWFSLILVVHVIVGLAVIVFVLLQHGKGADVGASFGGGASGSLFGASGSANFLSRTTAILATLFFMTSLTLTYLASHRTGAASSVLDTMTEQSVPAAAPAASAPQSGDIPK